MKTLCGYKIIEALPETPIAGVYRCRGKNDDGTVIVKMLKTQNPTVAETACFQNAYKEIQALTLPGLVKILGVEVRDGCIALIQEDFPGTPLKARIKASALNISDFLNIALQAAETLGKLHQADIRHGAVSSHHILLNPKTLEIKLTDFEAAADLTRRHQAWYDPQILDEVLPYLSPEQTGRMNRTVDYRTDIYSLGTVFYEMLTGRPPFLSGDPLELIHAHIARKAEPPMAVIKGIPAVLSDIVVKLLAKSPEERYQNAFGLLADLHECRNRLTPSGKIPSFEIARRDIPLRFNIPQQLFGRETETAALLRAFERAAGGGKEFMMLSGHPGTGKSVLIQEIHKSIVGSRGYFIVGRYERFRRTVPYNAIIQAFQNLLHQVLCESRERIGIWRQKILSTLGANGTILINVLPDLELIIGPQPQAPELVPQEAHRRLQLMLINLFRAMASADHPLVLFLDDLQWVDNASLQLMEALIARSDLAYFFLIGAYRTNDVTENHPLEIALKNISKSIPHVNIIPLEPLTVAHINSLLMETMRCAGDSTHPLAEVIHSKTNGNPFFVIHFLRSLHEDRLLLHMGETGWQWDLDTIRRKQATDNVVALMVEKIVRLPAATQEILKAGAAMGNRFDLETLAALLDKNVDDIFDALSDALSDGWVDARKDYYVFQHDRIQDAAYSLVPETKKGLLHHRIGRLALERTGPQALNERIFYIVNQLNLGRDQITQPQERKDLARLNLLAGKKSLETVSYETALQYLEMGSALLGVEGWAIDYPLALDLHLEMARAAYLNKNMEMLADLSGLILSKASSLLDQTKIYEINLKALYIQNRFEEAIRAGVEILEKLDINIPVEPTDEDIFTALEDTKSHVAGRPIEDFINLPNVKDPLFQSTMGILSILVNIAYDGSPRLYPVVACKMVNLSIARGNVSYSVYGYIAYGVVCCTLLGDIDTGYEFGRLTRALQKRLCARGLPDKSALAFNAFIRHWKEPTANSLAPFEEGFRIGMDTGDPQYAALCSHFSCSQGLGSGMRLDDATDKLSQSYRDIEKLQVLGPLRWTRIWQQTVWNFMGRSDDPRRLVGEDYNEEEMLLVHEAEEDFVSLFNLHFSKLLLNIHFGNPREALENAEKGKKYLSAVSGTFGVALFSFLNALACLWGMVDVDETEKAYLAQNVTANLGRLENWARHAPMNQLHRLHLLKAEQSGIAGNTEAAMEHYDRAADLAAENGYIYDEALANELAGRFYLEKGRTKIAAVYLQEARACYQRWGATAKVDHIDKKYAAHLSAAARTTTNGQKEILADRSASLDIGTVMKASRAISGEILLERLLAKLMRISMENAGAQRGLMILEDQGRLFVEAEGEIDEEDVQVLTSVSVEDHGKTSPAIVNYVARTQKPLILQDAAQTGEFTQDPYVKKFQPKSILCFPIISQGSLSGIIYLENHLTTGAFTAERLEVLNLISAQAAISLQNARLFDDVKRAETRMKNLLETANEGFWEVDRKGYTVDVNPELCRILGYSREELMGRHIFDFQRQVNVEAVRKASENLQRKEKASYEVVVPRQDGVTLYCQVNMSPIIDADKVVGSFAMLSDITRIKEVEREIRKLNADLEKRVKIRTIELNATLKKVEQANRNIMASIRYAQMIQQSLLPNPSEIRQHLPDSFCIWQPKDIIGGDIYHFEFLENGFIAAVMDCTGHGVPGAFMTMIAASGLRRIIRDEACHDPAEILKHLNRIVKTTLHQDKAQALSDDGLDAAVCHVAPGNGTFTYAGARLPLLYAVNGELKSVKGDRQSIGYAGSDLNLDFTNHSLPLKRGMRIYLHTDGIVDQMGGLNRRRFGRKRFTEILFEHMDQPLEHQRDAVLKAFKDHKGINEQQDDITVLGFGPMGVVEP